MTNPTSLGTLLGSLPAVPGGRIPDPEAVPEADVLAQRVGCPALYRDVSLDTFRLADEGKAARRQMGVLARARAFVAGWPTRGHLTFDFPQIVLMLGPFGTGKGHIAWSIVKAIAAQDTRARLVFTGCSDIIRDLRASWRAGSTADQSEAQRLAYYRTVDLLVIDEVSKHALLNEVGTHLYDIVNARQQALRPTILTSNETAQGIAALIGPALESRAAGWDAVWQFDWPDYRIAAATRRRAVEATNPPSSPAVAWTGD